MGNRFLYSYDYQLRHIVCFPCLRSWPTQSHVLCSNKKSIYELGSRPHGGKVLLLCSGSQDTADWLVMTTPMIQTVSGLIVDIHIYDKALIPEQTRPWHNRPSQKEIKRPGYSKDRQLERIASSFCLV